MTVRSQSVLAVLSVITSMAWAAEIRPAEPAADSYPPQEKLTVSPGNTVYFIDPAKGDDAMQGTSPAKPWKSIGKLNSLKLAPGDYVHIAPGLHEETLKPSGSGTADKPVTIYFEAGRHEFAAERALRRPYYVSNSCDAPQIPKPIGILLENVSHFHLQGGGTAGNAKTDIIYLGRMIQILTDHAENIAVSGLTFDLARPTVSEFRVLDVTPQSAVIQIAEGSSYVIENNQFRWTGDWGTGGLACQEVDLSDGRCWRRGAPRGWDSHGNSQASARDIGGRKVELTYAKDGSGLTKGHQYHFRLITRDSVAVHNTRSKNIFIHDCVFHNLTNMGIVSQFTENICYRHVHVTPPAGTIRTCAAWADAFHFSNCKGDVIVENCGFSGTQDDPINCHGTHLRIIGNPSPNQFLLRFMQPQTYGFPAYQTGDEVAVISHTTLRELPNNPRRKVAAVEKQSDKDWLITLDGPAPAFDKDDVIDNITWYPNLTLRDNQVAVVPTRGFLVTTRGKVLIENNTFRRCAMPAILVEDDAEGWFESGPVRDMTIRSNNFIGCGIQISPHNGNNDPNLPVHENIRIENNFFDGAGISAKNVRGLTIIDNRTTGDSLPVNTTACTETKTEGTVTHAQAPK